jgi:exopolyphosphatase/guanosine-5'-triphosphate,3'-diphosphate pyrophosphatase
MVRASMFDDDRPLAAIDLGSNSFRLEIARRERGRLRRLEYLKETVRLGAGLDESSRLSDTAMQRGWDCLTRFAARLVGIDPRRVRAVATQTVREACNRAEFVAGAQTRLGLPVDVISGREEARLIYAGVALFLPQLDEARLVFDIGGRSTEIIVGQGPEPKRMESYRVGSVELSMRCFGDGQLTAAAFEAARTAAETALGDAASLLAGASWRGVYGAAGTVRAVSDILRAEGMSDGVITPHALSDLVDRMARAGHVDRLALRGLQDNRRPVIGGGLAVLQALCKVLGLERIEPARGALRHGVLLELAPGAAPAAPGGGGTGAPSSPQR